MVAARQLHTGEWRDLILGNFYRRDSLRLRFGRTTCIAPNYPCGYAAQIGISRPDSPNVLMKHPWIYQSELDHIQQDGGLIDLDMNLARIHQQSKKKSA